MSFIQPCFEVFECIDFHVYVRVGAQRSLKTLVNLASFCQNNLPYKNIFLPNDAHNLHWHFRAARIFCCGLCGGVLTGGVEFANSKLASRQRASFIAVHSAQLFNFLA
jgi:hypothetical protein